MPTIHHDVFLAHNSADEAAVEALARRLVKAGLQPWFHNWHLIPGVPRLEEVEEALTKCTTCAVFIGPNGIELWQQMEVYTAIDRRVSTSNGSFRVIPVLLPGAERGERSKLPAFLSRTTWVEFRETLDDPDAFHRLLCGIRGEEPGPSPGKEFYGGTTPYRGLQVFDVEDWPFFFGREALVEWLLDGMRPHQRVQSENRFLAIIGPSGSGKSSLARAGFAAALRQGQLPGSEQWPVAICKPGSQPLESLAIAVGAASGNGPTVAATRDLIRSLREDAHTLHLTTRLTLRNSPEQHRLVVLVDQFEELFTLCRDTTQQQAMIDALLYASTVPQGQTIVVLTIRADFYGKCAAYPALAAALSDHQILVGPMTSDELRRAIERPALLSGCEFGSGLVTKLLDDVQGQAGGLPLMQHALLELWNRRTGRRLTHAAYEEIGGIAGALERRAEAIYAQLTEPEQRICQRIFLRLTQPGEGTEDTKRRVTLRELLPVGGDVTVFETVLRALANDDARLITMEGAIEPVGTSNGQDTRGAIGVEVAHEALIRSWGRLRGWIDADRAALLVHRQLTAAAAAWSNNQQESSYLYGGARLVAAQEWAESHLEDLNEDEQTFLEASLTVRNQEILEREEQQRQKVLLAAEQRRAVRLRQFLLVAGMLLLIAIGAMGAAVMSQQAARRSASDAEQARAVSQSLARAGEALLEMNNRPERSLALVLAALSTGSPATDPMVSRAVFNTFANNRIRKVLQGHSATVAAVAWSPDGTQVLTGSFDNTARLWDVTSGQVLHTLSDHNAAVYDAAWSPDGTQVLTGSLDGTARLWDVASGQVLHALSDHSAAVAAVAWSPDGTQVLTSSFDNTVRIWDVTSGQVLHTLSSHNATVVAVAWSPDGTQVLTGGQDNTARLWDVASHQVLHTLSGHSATVVAVAWSPDGTQVLTGSQDNTARLWDVTSGQILHTLSGHSATVAAVAWSPDGTQVLTSSFDNTLWLWDVASGQILHTLSSHSAAVYDAAWSPDGTQVLTGSLDGTARLWDVASDQVLHTLSDHNATVYDAAWSPDGTQVLTGSFDNTIQIWDVTSGQVLHTLSGHNATVYDAAWSPDGTQVLTGSLDGTARLWNVASGQILHTLSGDNAAVAWSPDGTQVLTISLDGTARLWDVTSGQILHTLSGHSATVAAVAWSPDGTQVLTSSFDNTVRIWDVTSGQVLHTLSGHSATVVAVAWSPDGTQVLTGSQDNTARLWDVASGQVLHTLSGHSATVVAVAWSPDGTQVLTGSQDNTARLWDVTSGQILHTLSGHSAAVVAVAWSPDGTQVLTSSFDNTVRIWLVDQQLMAAVLTQQLCDVYQHDDATIRSQVSGWDWEGCAKQLRSVDADLKAFNALSNAK